MKRIKGDVLRTRGGAGRHTARVHRLNRQQLRDLPGDAVDSVRQPDHRQPAKGAVRRPREITNWRVYVVERERFGHDLVWMKREVIALEPDREYENVFTGPTDFQDALEYAAAELRKGHDDHRDDDQHLDD